MAISLLLVTVYIYVSNIQTEKEYNDQIESVSDLHKVIPKDAPVYIVDSSKAYYFLGQYRSVNSSKIGYSFSSYFFPKTIVGNLKPGSFLIVGEKSLLKYTKELKAKYQLSEMMIEKKKYIIVETLK